jgi:hypothetical protein
MATKDISDAQVCRAVQAYQDAMQVHYPRVWPQFVETGGPLPPYPYEALAAETGQAEKVCYRAMERAYDRGLLECGVSLRTGWLTPAGVKKVSEGG